MSNEKNPIEVTSETPPAANSFDKKRIVVAVVAVVAVILLAVVFGEIA